MALPTGGIPGLSGSLPVGQLLGIPPYPGHSRFLVPSGTSAKGQNDISISVSVLREPSLHPACAFLPRLSVGAPSP